MADEQVQKTAQEAEAEAEAAPEVVVDVKTDVLPQHENEKEPLPLPESQDLQHENEKEPLPMPLPESQDLQPLKPNPVEEPITTLQTEMPKPHESPASFEEETTKVSDLPDLERRALQDLKHLVQEALHSHEFSTSLPAEAADGEHSSTTATPQEPETTIPEEKEKTADHDSLEQAQVQLQDKAADMDDGAKTVEAIEETVVSVSSSVPHEQPQPQPQPEAESSALVAQPPKEEQVSIWGIPLLADERSDVILLKFLRARDFKVKDAFAMLKNTLRWRKQFGMDELVDQQDLDLGNHDWEKLVFMHGLDKEGHPVCYNVYGEFQNKQLYQNTFSDEEKRHNFLRWRIQFLERSIRKLDFTPGGVCTIVQVNDLNNSPGPGKWELRQATKQALQVLQDNYPEFVAKQVFINVPWWYLAVNRMISPFLTQRTKSKFVFAGPSKSADTLLRYIAAEQVPIKYGGLSKDGEFGKADAVTEITLRPAAKHTVEFPVTESCLLSWEVRVVGWEVKYGAEFVPSAEESYIVIIQKSRKFGSAEEPVVCNSFKIGEPGKVVLTIDNPTSKKKKLLYRLKTKPCSDSSI